MKNLSSLSGKCPEGFSEHLFETRFHLPDGKSQIVWDLLQKRETFTRGQVPPFRVEFDNPSQEGNFREGELNIHHGPLMSLHGVIGEITPTYRDLRYFFGSYIISFRFIRPYRLEFFRDGEEISLKIHSHVKPWIKGIWDFGNYIFWRFFGITFLFKRKDIIPT